MKTKRKTELRQGCCPPPEDVVASVMDGEMDAHRDSLQHHLEGCPACRKLVEDTRASMGVLHCTEDDPISHDLVSGILARIPQDAWRHRAREARRARAVYSCTWMPLRIAATALALLGGTLLVLHVMTDTSERRTGQTPRASAVDRGIEWLLTRQTALGGWNAEALGGKPEYAPALNGLAVLALTRADGKASDLTSVLARAAAFLVQQQAEDGRLGKDFGGTMYNHGIATLALLEVYGVTQDEQLHKPITKALAFIRHRQSPVGGWGYRDQQSSLPNLSITAWQVQALLLADRQGWQENRIPVRKALAWMTRTVNGNGFFGYERAQHFPEGPHTLTMMGTYCMLAAQQHDIPVDPNLSAKVIRGMGKLADTRPADYYGAFFYSSALSEADPDTFRDALTAAHDALIARQQTTGHNAGTWLPDDPWGGTGGQLYSTSMALLALAQHPHHNHVL